MFLSLRRWGKCQLSICIIRVEWKTMGILGKIIKVSKGAKAGLMGGKALGGGTKSGQKKSEIDDLKLEPKGTKQRRRGSKQNVKGNEMEEQLTLVRFLISNLERKKWGT